MKQHDESNLTSSESIGSLKKEIPQYKEAEANFAQYIADLKACLLRADESVLDFQQAVERLERETARCREKVEVRTKSLDPFSGNTSGATRRRPMRNMSKSTGSHRLFFRHTALVESLHSRSANSPNPSPNDTDSQRSYIQIAFTISIALAGAVLSHIVQTSFPAATESITPSLTEQHTQPVPRESTREGMVSGWLVSFLILLESYVR